MRFDCEITNATIVDPGGRYRATIVISGEKIAGILAEPSGNAARTIDAEGLCETRAFVKSRRDILDRYKRELSRSGRQVLVTLPQPPPWYLACS